MIPPRPPRKDDGRRGLDGAPLGGETPDAFGPVTPIRRPLAESPNPRLRAMTTRARARRLSKLIEELRHEEAPDEAVNLLATYHDELEGQAKELEAESERRLEAERAAELERQAVTFVEDGIPPTEAELAAAAELERVDAWDDLGGRP